MDPGGEKVYDFEDFCEAVQQANSAKLNVSKMHFIRGIFSYKTEFENDFIDLKDIFVMRYVKGALAKP
nr:unnamed protein product [Callosobruchus analis]